MKSLKKFRMTFTKQTGSFQQNLLFVPVGKSIYQNMGREQIVIHKAAGLVFPIKEQILKLYVKKSNQNIEIKDIISGNSIEVENYYFNSFMDISDDDIKNSGAYRYIKLEHNIFDEYVIIEFANIIFCKIKC